jgi:hypothetical protein
MKTITPPPLLNGSHLRTYEKIFAHPATHNLAWRDVLALLSHLGAVTAETNTNLRVSRNGHILILPPPRTKEVTTVDELVKLRHFLAQSENKLAEANLMVGDLLVVIDHHRARLFRTELQGTAPRLILPYEPDEYFRHAHDDRSYFSGKGKPAPASFFEPVARALQSADKILLFGTGTGTSSEMDQFSAWLGKHHPDLARRIIGAHVIDEHHLTEPQLLAKARELYQYAVSS